MTGRMPLDSHAHQATQARPGHSALPRSPPGFPAGHNQVRTAVSRSAAHRHKTRRPIDSLTSRIAVHATKGHQLFWPLQAAAVYQTSHTAIIHGNMSKGVAHASRASTC